MFTTLYNQLIARGFARKVAVLAARIVLGVDTAEGLHDLGVVKTQGEFYNLTLAVAAVVR